MKKVLCSLIIAMVSLSAFAFGKKDVEERAINQLDSWQEDFDLEKKKEGKYNVLVTVEDKGGNTSLGGPFNIFIDPDSDYTISRITNPTSEMRVQGNLNIVGTCVDDDGVEEVWLILDGGVPVKAEGKEFWSYYLDTNELSEGKHTIEVFGVDINGLSSEGKKGKTDTITWNLDRRQPVIEVTNIEIGSIVSGKIELKGTVSDGNGIRDLFYSLDGGVNYSEVKIKEDKKTGICSFSLPIDTRASKDGAQVCWFRARDKMGSTGSYSFLYIIDNTAPDVKIVYPKKNETMNGKFGIAGYAKDDVGIRSLSWSFGSETGEFELVPGNPYWYKEVDTTGMDKNAKFTITAVDMVDNKVVREITIPLNQEDDKPVVEFAYPAADSEIEVNEGIFFVSGIASDDDGVASIEYSLDGGAAQTFETQGVFYAPIALESPLSYGRHTVTVTATDIYGIRGNPFTVSFVAQGAKPQFKDAVISSAAGETALIDGISVNPEASPVLRANIESQCGLNSVTYKYDFGSGSIREGSVTLGKKDASSTVPVSIALSDIPWGVVNVTVTATDVYNRVTEFKKVLEVADLTQIQTKEPRVVFDDSRVEETGRVVCNETYPLTGYFAGGTIKSASLVPNTNFARLEFDEHTVKLYSTGAIGNSSPVRVRVVTTEDAVYESRNLIFMSDSPAPEVFVENRGNGFYFNGEEAVTVSGRVDSEINLASLSYRIITVPAVFENGYVKSAGTPVVGEFVRLEPMTGNFSFTLSPDQFQAGISIVEVVANNGKEGAAALKVRRIPDVPPPADGRRRIPAPVIAWADGFDVYYVTLYNGTLDNLCGTFERRSMIAGANELSVSVTDEAGKVYNSKYTAQKTGTLDVFIDNVSGTPYASGMNVQIPHGRQTSPAANLTAAVYSDLPVSAVSYSIESENQYGGTQKQSGTVNAKELRAVEAGKIEADIPLNYLPAGLAVITVTAETSAGSKTYKGTVGIVRAKEQTEINSQKGVLQAFNENVNYDMDNGRYVTKTGEKLSMYANMLAPLSASFVSAQNGLKIEVEGNVVSIIAENEGLYRNVAITVEDAQGVRYSSSPVNILADSNAPSIEIQSPVVKQWVQKSVELTLSVRDTNGISSVEYSLDSGATWNSIQSRGSGIYSAPLDIQYMQDGYLPIDVRAFDIAGKVSYAGTVIQKDTTPPIVEVIVPYAPTASADEKGQNENETIKNVVSVNGENTIAFLVKDENGAFARAEYVPPVGADGRASSAIALDRGAMIVTHVGTQDKPISDLMTFNFYDEVGNVNSIQSWDFIIDESKDLPVSEIHLPEENAVITKDFVVSGVILDDDGFEKDENGAVIAGPKVYYKIDNGEFIALEEPGMTFAIPVPISALTDNEHSVTVYAEDINGVRGPEFTRNFCVSLEEPKGGVTEPVIEHTVRDAIRISGNATDKNGISKVYVSLDNGNSYNEALGEFSHEISEAVWYYDVDTRVIEDGTHVVFTKIVDWYGIEGIYSSLINVDNTAPSIELELPLDGALTTRNLFFSGFSTDNIGIEHLYISVRSLENKRVSPELSRIELVPDLIITQVVDLNSLESGTYNIELIGTDAAENVTRVSRNIILDKTAPSAKVDMLYPLNGEEVRGVFNIYGTVESEIPVATLDLLVDGEKAAETELTTSGYFKFTLDPVSISEGAHKVQVRANLRNASTIMSNEQYLTYSSTGPWVTIDNFTYGDFAINRPFIEGNAGYAVSEEEMILSRSKDTSKEVKEAIAAKAVEKVELSLDNGKTFETLSEKGKWRYRVENEDIREGFHFLLVRATMKNGETAVTRTIVQVDKNAPEIKLISPGEGGRYNQSLEFSGLASDDVALKNVTLALRKGDKSSYEVPAFIQGLYFDWQFWGATLFNIGAGLSFFDDNVKLQVQWGQFTAAQRSMFEVSEMRYGGNNILGMKILANVSYIPFRYFFGPDWEWLSANIAVGANFTRFNETQSGKAQILSAMLCQVEFPRITLSKQKMFRTIAVYTEGQLWFIPTDVSGAVDIQNIVPQISVGLRVNVF